MCQGEAALQTVWQPGAQSMPALFRRNGYHTSVIGKISHTADGRVYQYNCDGACRVEMPLAWTEMTTPLGCSDRGWGVSFGYSGGRHREDAPSNRDLMEFTVENDDDLPDGLVAERAIQKLGEFRPSDHPFFLGLGFFKPPLPFAATRRDWEHFQNVHVPAPENPGKHNRIIGTRAESSTSVTPI